jgi:hypothetical protein
VCPRLRIQILARPHFSNAYNVSVKTKLKLAGAKRVKGGVLLTNPVRISEDEADAIITRRSLADKRKRISLEELMRRRGHNSSPS